ncbi:TPA: progesterone receptor [Bos taurus]|nr:TPA: progesterone receptor [Bos taurus]
MHQPGTANECTVLWWFKKICKGDRALKKSSTVTSHRKLTVTNERIIDTDPLIVTQEIANLSMVIWHLKQIGKVKNPMSDLVQNSFLNPSRTVTSEEYAQHIDEVHQKLQCLQLALVNRRGPIRVSLVAQQSAQSQGEPALSSKSAASLWVRRSPAEPKGPDSEASQSPQYSFESLPQKICLICGDEASGCHYGVLTCGSCKVFFKRAMEGQHNYLCAGRNDCIVDKIRRKNCPACRLRKCCQAGMVLGGRKFKKFNKVRVMRTLDAVALPQPVGIPNESQALSQRITFSPSQDLQLIPPLINLLMSIEPDVVYAGHDNSKPDTSSSLLTSLNQLGERQLLSVVKWSKSLPGFRNLHIDDQITLIQYSWMSLMVFGLGWRSYKHVSGQMLYFAPDLILNEQRMKESSFYSLCLTMWQIPQEFVKLQVSQEEFLCMKVLLLLNTIPLEGLRSQNQFEEMRSSYIRELIKAIGLRQKGVVPSSQRFYQLTKLLDNLHDLVKQLHLYCLNTFIQSWALSVEFPEMMSEVIAAQLPKILAGMVKSLLFHKK